ncbi:PPOX class F420-dependent oxidoreductase [Tomitella biformata]|uniref:PPOX class F420-dependent oxidoreductase n=1 Tax=Tomitella biformata TaxID=630403 RepID=UPI000467D6E9|nr:PPOX class F420-dependent oxidoreductase [Tomitella biformata]
MAIGPEQLNSPALEFLVARHLATLTTLREDGTPHVVVVGFTWDHEAGLARVITNGPSQKVLNVRRGGYAALTQLEGPRWLTLEGPAEVLDDEVSVADAVERYAGRYRQPQPNPARVVIQVKVQRVLGLQTFQR